MSEDLNTEQIVEDALKSIKSNDSLYLECNLNNLPNAKQEYFVEIANALKRNTKVHTLQLANCQLGNEAGKAICEMLKTNETITNCNLETNKLGDEFVMALAECLRENKTLKELKLTNQYFTYSFASEMEFAKALETNQTIVRCSLQVKDNGARNLVDRWLSRNKDLERKKRLSMGPQTTSVAASKVSAKLASNQENEPCLKCHKHAYKAERVEIERGTKKDIYHKTCFKCAECSVQLTVTNYGILDNILYCRIHQERMQMMSSALTATLSSNITNKDSFLPPTKSSAEVKEEKKQLRMETSNAVAEKVKKNADSEKCDVCGKTVYAAERLDLDIRGGTRKLLHKNCFRCGVCNTLLKVTNYGSIEGRFFCQKDLKAETVGKKSDAYFLSPLAQPQDPSEREREIQEQEAIRDRERALTSTSNIDNTSSNYPAPSSSSSSNNESSSTINRTSSTSSLNRTRSGTNLDEPAPAPAKPGSGLTKPIDPEVAEMEERMRRREERKKQREEEEKQQKSSSSSSTTTTATSPTSTIGSDEVLSLEERMRRREERKKREAEEASKNNPSTSSSSTTTTDESEERRKRREERRKREEEEQKSGGGTKSSASDDYEKRAEERRKRLEAARAENK